MPVSALVLRHARPGDFAVAAKYAPHYMALGAAVAHSKKRIEAFKGLMADLKIGQRLHLVHKPGAGVQVEKRFLFSCNRTRSARIAM